MPPGARIERVVRSEIKLQQNPAFDPSTRVATGKLAQPDVFVDGSISIVGDHYSWSVKITDAITGEVQTTLQNSEAGDDLFEAEEALAKKLAEELCKARPGFVLSGRMDEATIKGFVCGNLSKPFTAKSPEVAAHLDVHADQQDQRFVRLYGRQRRRRSRQGLGHLQDRAGCFGNAPHPTQRLRIHHQPGGHVLGTDHRVADADPGRELQARRQRVTRNRPA